MADKTFYIVDGHAHIFASYYAIRGLSSPSGEPTNAVFGFTATVLSLLRERGPDAVAIVFDPPGPTFRSDIYAEYKANRDKAPEDLPKQVDRARQVTEALGFRPLTVDGFEADDVIATLARRGQAEGYRVFIVSKDKDLEQIIGDGIVMYDAKNSREIDADALFEKKGYRPDQAVDVQSLTGDSTDNIPGVPGVGPKTAAKLLGEYDTLENLLAHSDEIKGKVGERIRENTDAIDLSRKLVTLRDDVKLDVGPGDLGVVNPDPEKVKLLFDELGFERFLEQLDIAPGQGVQAAVAAAEQADYECIDTEAKLKKLVAELKKQKAFAIDTETSELDPMRAELVGISLSWEAGTGCYIPTLSPGGGGSGLPVDKVIDALRPVLEDASIGKVGHHLKYDFQVIAQTTGVRMAGLELDTMLAAFLLDPEGRDVKLDSLVKTEFGHAMIPISDLIGKGKDQISMRDVPVDRASTYAAEDADFTWRLYELLAPQLDEAGLRKLHDEVELPLSIVLADMEAAGVGLDVDFLAKMGKEMEGRIAELTTEIHEAAEAEFNIDSPKQLAEILFDRLALPVVKKTKTGYSTDVEVLEQLQSEHDVPRLVLEYRQLTKLKSTYIDALPAAVNPNTKRVHPNFRQTRAATGRLACTDPNLQNIPVRTEIGRKIRAAFVPAEKGDVLLTADYSQIELRMLAHLSEDPALMAAFEEDQDIHSFVAAQVFDVAIRFVTPEQRRVAKAVNFGIIYGQTPFGLAKALGIPQSDARAFIDAYYKKYSTIRRFMDRCIEQAKEKGFVTTILGRRRFLPQIESRNRNQRQLAERLAVNTVTQGSAADLIKIAMINIHRRIADENLPLQMLIQVHDELVFELPEADAEAHAEMIRNEMSGAMDLKVPLKVDAAWGASWLEAK